MADLKLQHIYKNYNKNVLAVKDFNLDIKDREFIVLVGPSGCGKSTILRLVAGLEDLSQGDIIIEGKRMNDVAPKDRDIAFVFQNYALYPHMNVYHNMAFGLKSRKFPKDEIDRRVKEATQVLGLEEYMNRKPKALSGGQRQRVALGRAIVRDAKIFLMDEPLSNLDAKLRAQMRTEIIKLHQRLQTTTIYVTHDQTEAMTMATRLVVMNNGVIQQVGAPEEIYEKPENVFVGSFIGSPAMNFFTGILSKGKMHIGDVSIVLPERTNQSLHEQGYANKEITLGIRPEDFRDEFAFIATSSGSIIDAKVEVKELLGAETLIYSQIAGQPFIARLDARSDIKQEQILPLAMDMNKVHFFDCKTENRISLDGE
ncbi:sn-glycerol-3-phosphate ABC transporter ATP-binding protein UgpC [Cytobacillus depressus]|uniref:sn-glycerol-3-phosphate ABC transporter ATP-binding protein UgpC n=1 Tax=Cytobacillus depressus TaxID=1602942 RepID=A0A6L3V971_9BACI|nr:sn-glycerol-3-phosphate ABC transporter ATP-binding protein UgpC [Cytobacillus depressus]KAB2334505.1 sn-glycerol-3-phosphate ABC transporter ATP-binding protein UgpC [Cytobacillus depressus]